MSRQMKRSILFFAIWVAVLSIYYFALWRPMRMGVIGTKRQIISQSAVLNQVRRDIESWPKTVTAEKLKKAENELERLLSMIPPEENDGDVLEWINSHLSKLPRLLVTDIRKKEEKQTPPPENQQYRTRTYTITLEGAFEDVISFIESLESAEKFVSVEYFQFDRGTDEPGIRSQIDLTFYYSQGENTQTDEMKGV